MTLPVSYTTVDLMILTFTSLNSTSTITSEQMNLHAGTAEALINAKIAKKYEIPLTDSIPLLQTLATDIAIYNIVSTSIALQPKDGNSPWYLRFKDALETLNKISEGDLSLVNSAGSVLSGRNDIEQMYSNTKDYVPTFYEGSWPNMVIDPNKIVNEDNRR